jgi:hypothetical protein
MDDQIHNTCMLLFNWHHEIELIININGQYQMKYHR